MSHLMLMLKINDGLKNSSTAILEAINVSFRVLVCADMADHKSAPITSNHFLRSVNFRGSCFVTDSTILESHNVASL